MILSADTLVTLPHPVTLWMTIVLRSEGTVGSSDYTSLDQLGQLFTWVRFKTFFYIIVCDLMPPLSLIYNHTTVCSRQQLRSKTGKAVSVKSTTVTMTSTTTKRRKERKMKAEGGKSYCFEAFLLLMLLCVFLSCIQCTLCRRKYCLYWFQDVIREKS